MSMFLSLELQFGIGKLKGAKCKSRSVFVSVDLDTKYNYIISIISVFFRFISSVKLVFDEYSKLQSMESQHLKCDCHNGDFNFELESCS